MRPALAFIGAFLRAFTCPHSSVQTELYAMQGDHAYSLYPVSVCMRCRVRLTTTNGGSRSW